jgi:hypothetical protein
VGLAIESSSVKCFSERAVVFLPVAQLANGELVFCQRILAERSDRPCLAIIKIRRARNKSAPVQFSFFYS